jgi:hypothetical protein
MERKFELRIRKIRENKRFLLPFLMTVSWLSIVRALKTPKSARPEAMMKKKSVLVLANILKTQSI